MVSMPERRWACGSTSTPGGLGVVGRDGIGVTDRETTPLSLASLDSVRSNKKTGEQEIGNRDE
jgi:hypothetical protein